MTKTKVTQETMRMTVLTTARLRLEPICDEHLAGLFELNSDPEVMRYITGKPDTLEDTQAMITRCKARWAEWGYSWWACIESASGALIGAGAIQHLGHDAVNPLEIGWRFRKDKWRQGFASEAARCMAGFAFDTLKPPCLLAVCHPDNLGSARVMQGLGMRYRGQEPWYKMDCAVYEISAEQWRAQAAAQPSSPPQPQP
ncbi:GNAT family N-acetyltransferase [Paucibacter sp. TC2R-5]|uniref:GNAT family N-acetyltransferase n=1 Tax=Paucibacter sp. TC2R-5 TaxID=2893555 RepID=UPI0021E3EA5D|nr:GNAT family N-acetyltransferase [Paucibacter sp. TC2R-5]MCV2358938.1 GNAT family N-acetyltransferase [Paucibacter sp. TC2R-5]